ncbi:BRISC and BRCA1-A complex member 1, partial [Frankliniella fusca]
DSHSRSNCVLPLRNTPPPAPTPLQPSSLLLSGSGFGLRLESVVCFGSRLLSLSIQVSQNCPPERILVCVDACEDRPVRGFNQHVKQHSTFSTIKNCAEAFILNKAAMNQDHKFSVCVFKGQMNYMSGFHSRVQEHIKQIQAAVANQPSDQPYQLSHLFKYIYDKAIKEEEEGLPLRVVLFFGRSGSCFLGDNVLLSCKNVIIDVLFLHKPVLSAKERKRIEKNLFELKKCLSEKSICSAALSDSPLALKSTMYFLMHPNLRVPSLNDGEIVYTSDSD